MIETLTTISDPAPWALLDVGTLIDLLLGLPIETLEGRRQ